MDPTQQIASHLQVPFSKHEEEPSRIIVRAWCHKMQWMYDKEMSSTSEGFRLTPELMAEYTEPDELIALLPRLKKKETLSRVDGIRKMPFR